VGFVLNKTVVIIASLALMGAVLVCGTACAQSSGNPGNDSALAEPLDAADPLAARRESLDLRARVAQLMLVTLSGLYAPNVEDRALLDACPPGGVVLSKAAKPEYVADYVKALHALPGEARLGIPLLIGADPYDLVTRQGGLGTVFLQLPSLLSLAGTGDAAHAARLAELVAGHFETLGFNLCLGPSLELAPSLPRAKGTLNCLGSAPEFVGSAGAAILDTLAERGLIAMPMGFPGGGCNRLQNGPATLLVPRPLLPQQDLAPFVRAVEHGVPVVHVANTLVPTLDPSNRPASVSFAVMHDLLREELGFEGVVVAGPIDAPDMRRLYDPAQAALEALKAGADMIYWSGSGQRVVKAVDTIVLAVKAGTLEETRITEALARIAGLKRRHMLLERKLPAPNSARVLQTGKRYAKDVYEIGRRSITLVQNRAATLPLTKAASLPVGVTGTVGVEELAKALRKHLKAVVQQPIMTARHTGEIEDFEIYRLTAHAEGVRTAVCVFADTQKTVGQRELIRAFKEQGLRVVVVLVGYPTNLPQLLEADAILLAYCDAAAYSQTMKAAADVLAGFAPMYVPEGLDALETRAGKTEDFNALDVVRAPTGRLPVTLAPPFEAGFAVPYNASLAVKKTQWDFGDGKRAKGLIVQHAYQKPGRYPVSVAVTDTHGDTVQAQLWITVDE